MPNSARKRILYLCADDGIPVWGSIGGSTHIREIVLGLRDLGYDVTVVAANTAETTDPELQSIPVIAAPLLGDEPDAVADKEARRSHREGLRMGRNDPLRELLQRLHNEQAFDAVYERYSLFGYAGFEFAQAAGLPFLLEVNAPLVEETQRHRTLALGPAAEAIRVRLFNESSHMIAVSNAVARHIISISPTSNVSVLPNAVNRERYETLPEPGEYRERYGINETSFTVGYLGSFKPWHGLPNLIDAVAELKEAELNVRLMIIGEGQRLRPELEARCQRHNLDNTAIFTGEISFRDAPAALSACDALVAPYPRIEGFYFSPLKLFEYMASGSPVVASAIGQINDILEHERTALLVPPGDVTRLARALRRLHDDREMATQIGKAARKLALTKHTWASRASEIHSLIQSADPVRLQESV